MTTSADLARLDPHERIDRLRRAIAAVPGRTREHTPELFGPTDIVDDIHTRTADTAGQDPQTPAPAAGAGTHRAVPVPAALADLLPHRGLRRGSVTTVTGASSIELAVITGATAAGGHVAAVGHPRLSLLAAHEMGAELTRCAWIPDPGPDPVEVAAVLLDGLDVVLLDLAGAGVPPTRARAVTARARSKGAALVITRGHWPATDITINAEVTGYAGLEHGHGRITGIDLEVTVTGRGIRPRSGNLEITGRRGRTEWTTDTGTANQLRQAQ